MNITIVSGSRADHGLLMWPTKLLKEDSYFSVAEVKVWGTTPAQSLTYMTEHLSANRPDMLLLLGDRFEIMAAAWAAHLLRVPIAHIGGGDTTLGSYDDAMRDCISRMATVHLTTSAEAQHRLRYAIAENVHLVGNPGADYIMHAPWRDASMPKIQKPYVLVAYYPETIDGTVDLAAVNEAIAGRPAIWMKCNPDRGAERIPGKWEFGRNEFLSILANCDEFIGNSSAIFYEAPVLGVKTRLIGKRQQGRVVPLNDGKASERIRDILKAWRPS